MGIKGTKGTRSCELRGQLRGEIYKVIALLHLRKTNILYYVYCSLKIREMEALE